MFEAKVNGSKAIELNNDKDGWLINGSLADADLKQLNKHSFQVLYKGASHTVHVVSIDRDAKTVVLKVDGKKAEVSLSTELDRLLKRLGFENTNAAKVSDIKAPMPGLIHSIKVAEGGTVSKGDPLLILEAMKMENIIKAPADGTVGKIHVTKGQNVDKGMLMISMK
jgi:biotin carboxyl carrier protein